MISGVRWLRARAPRCRALLLVLAFALPPARAYQLYRGDGFEADGSVNLRLGLRYGENINYGFGALTGFGRFASTTGEEQRVDLQAAIKPALKVNYALPRSQLYGGLTVVAATTTLDGELSGQTGRAGDQVLDTDAAYVGWRNELLDLSYGGQEFSVGDGFIIGDGNFNQGHDNGQYWTGAFTAWRNTGILKVNTNPIRGDVFWLRTDGDLGDSRVVGINVQNSNAEPFGTLGLMYFEIIDDNSVIGYAGMQVAGIRGADLHLPAMPQFKLFGEFVHQGGKADLNGVENDADAWYIEGMYEAEALPWRPRFFYRYARYSGDEAGTADNEEYRGLFFTIGKRDWDTWYQGEISGEFHLFNENQITHMLKAKAYPAERWAVATVYYRHSLEEPQYFGIPTLATDWTDEVNVWVEHYPDDRLYVYAGVAWATPGAAAEEIFGNEDQLVLQFFISYTFN